MAQTFQLDIPEVGSVKVTKKAGMKHVRLRITPKGELVVSAPWFADKRSITRFVMSQRAWISENFRPVPQSFYNGMRIGDGVLLKIEYGHKRNRSRHTADTLHLYLTGDESSSAQHQSFIEQCIHKNLTTQAENILLPRLLELSSLHHLPFHQASVKRLVSRWGSCDSQKNIILNIYLMQVPPKLRDYVILHELNHTRHMNHSAAFWADMEAMMPSVKLYRRLMKQHKPTITPTLQQGCS